MRTLATALFAILISSCAANTASPSLPAAVGGAARHVAASRSWMLPAAKSQDLLYVSDLEAQSVFVYAYKSGKLVGTLTGFFNPEGLCVDRKGDVWVTNDTSGGDHQIIEYAHGGTTPLSTLDDPDGRVNGCAIDPKTGNLAVTNFWGPTERAGGVSIYTDAKGTPTSYTDSSIYYYYYCGYDNSGNLYADGLSYGSAFGLAELPSGGSSMLTVSLDQEIYLPGGVQWDGTYLAVGDQVAVKHSFESVIYQFSISGSTGTLENTLTLPDAKQVAQFWLTFKKGQANKVIGPNGNGADTLVWAYPTTGNPIKTYSGETDPTGATLSLAKH